MLLKSAFWDYPELCDEKNLADFLRKNEENSVRYNWAVSRLLEGARVKDILVFLSWGEIESALSIVKISEEQRRKWIRLLEVYAAQRK